MHGGAGPERQVRLDAFENLTLSTAFRPWRSCGAGRRCHRLTYFDAHLAPLEHFGRVPQSPLYEAYGHGSGLPGAELGQLIHTDAWRLVRNLVRRRAGNCDVQDSWVAFDLGDPAVTHSAPAREPQLVLVARLKPKDV